MTTAPAFKGLKPWTDCRYWVRRNSEPKRLKKVRETAPLAALKRGLRKKRMSSIGLAECSSHQTNPPRMEKPATNAVRMGVDAHPLAGASMTPHRMAARPAMDRRAPTKSIRAPVGSRESGTKNHPPMRAAITMGTLTKNTEPQ